MNFGPLIGSLAAVLTTAAYVPQAYKTIRTRATSGLSLPTYLLLFAGCICWTLYGFYLHSLPMIACNSISGVLTGIILGLMLSVKR